MKKLIFVILFCLLNVFAFAQEKSTLDFKLGVGRAVLGSGDYWLYRFEGELTKKWNKLISSSVAINVGIGYDNQIFLRHANSFHADLNVFISPFGNQRANNFKIGTGFCVDKCQCNRFARQKIGV